jgi:hypothetical protein
MFIELASRTIISLHQVKAISIHNGLYITIKYFNKEPEITIAYEYKISAQTDYKKIKDMLIKSCSNK